MRIHCQNDWFIDNILALSTNFVCQKIYGLLHLCEVRELLVWYLIELSPWLNVL